MTLDVTHPFRGDLEAYLISPAGTRGRLMIRSTSDGASDIHWTFVTHAFWGERPEGTWSLEVRDVLVSDTGTWTSFAVTARMGRPIPATRVLAVSSTAPDGAYGPGAVIPVTVAFTAPVAVSTAGGTPTLLLETGAVDRAAVYADGSGTATLTFLYTVAEGDASPHLDCAGTGALALNGGTISGLTGCDVDLALPTPGTAGSLAANRYLIIDTSAPVVGVVSDGPGPGDIDAQVSTTSIAAIWAGFADAESGIASYAWAIGTTPGGTDVRDFATVEPPGATAASVEGLSLVGGATCYVTVRAVNGAGMAVAATSDGVTVALNVAIPLVEGYNLVALPVRPVTPHTAQSLAEEMGRGGPVVITRVLRLNGTGYDVYTAAGVGTNFDIRPGEGYFVRCAGSGPWTARGIPLGSGVTQIALKSGYNLVGLSRIPGTPYTASAVLAEIGGSATRLLDFNGSGYDVYTSSGGGTDFAVSGGRGYFIRCSDDTTWTLSR